MTPPWFRVEFNKKLVSTEELAFSPSQKGKISISLSRDVFLPQIPAGGVEYCIKSWCGVPEKVTFEILDHLDQPNNFLITAQVADETIQFDNIEFINEHILSNVIGYWDHIFIKVGTTSILTDWLDSKEVRLIELSNRLRNFSPPAEDFYENLYLADFNRSKEAYRIRYVFAEMLKRDWPYVETELNEEEIKKLRTVEAFLDKRGAKRGILTRLFGSAK
jgi:hypothetical protein